MIPFARPTPKESERAKPGIRHYVRWKIRLDPVYRAVLDGLPDGVRLVDLGGGLGILAQLALALGTQRSAVVVEWDAAKVAAKRRAQGGQQLQANRQPACARGGQVNILAVDPGGVGHTVAFADLAGEEDKVTLAPPQDEFSHRCGRRRQGMAKGGHAGQKVGISRHHGAIPYRSQDGGAERVFVVGGAGP